MNNRCFCRLIIPGVALLLIVGLDGCQQASYSFLPAPSAYSAPTEAVALAGAGAAVADTSITKAPGGNAKQIAGLNRRPSAVRKHATRSASQAMTDRLAQTRALVKQRPFNPRPSAAAPVKKIPAPTPDDHRSKGVAVLLAGVLGMFGAHLFYLGYPRRALGYLITTLVCIGLLLVAIPVANLAVFGSGIGGAFVGIFILVMGAGGIALTYLKALFDVVRILTDSFPY